MTFNKLPDWCKFLYEHPGWYAAFYEKANYAIDRYQEKNPYLPMECVVAKNYTELRKYISKLDDPAIAPISVWTGGIADIGLWCTFTGKMFYRVDGVLLKEEVVNWQAEEDYGIELALKYNKALRAKKATGFILLKDGKTTHVRKYESRQH